MYFYHCGDRKIFWTYQEQVQMKAPLVSLPYHFLDDLNQDDFYHFQQCGNSSFWHWIELHFWHYFAYRDESDLFCLDYPDLECGIRSLARRRKKVQEIFIAFYNKKYCFITYVITGRTIRLERACSWRILSIFFHIIPGMIWAKTIMSTLSSTIIPCSNIELICTFITLVLAGTSPTFFNWNTLTWKMRSYAIIKNMYEYF